MALAALWAQQLLRCAWNPEHSCCQSSVCSDGPAADDGDGDDDAIVLASSVMPGGIGATLPGCSPGWKQHRAAGGTEGDTKGDQRG